MPVPDRVSEQAERRPLSPALTGADGTLTWAETHRAVEASAAALEAQGVGRGTLAVVHAEPVPSLVLTLHALWRLGAVVMPRHPTLTGAELAEMRSSLGPHLEVTPGRLGDSGFAAPWGARTVPEAAPPDALPSGEPFGPDAAAVVWTSGTSGTPTGVILGHSGLTHVAEASVERMGLRDEDRWSLTLSPAHVGGLAMIVRCALVGCSLRVSGTFSAERTAAEIRAGLVTHLSVVPTMWDRIVALLGGEVPHTLRGVLLGGAPAPASRVGAALAEGFPVFPTYGMTEASSQIATALPQEAHDAPGTVGRPLRGVEVHIAPDGEIMVRGPSVALGRMALPGSLTDEQGWLATGDLGTLDAHGLLFVRGRKGDRIISGGVNVDPLEVEALVESVPGVRAACAVGGPDPEWGERVAVLVEVAGDAHAICEGIQRTARERLSPAKRPRTIKIVEALPRNRTGKLDRRAARELLDS